MLLGDGPVFGGPAIKDLQDSVFGFRTLPQGTRIGRTALRIDDLDELTRFYRNVVGLRVLDDSESRSVLGVAEVGLLIIDLVTPFVLRSECPVANNVDIPWWDVDGENQLRRRPEKVVGDADVYELDTVDRSVVVGYDGDPRSRGGK